MAFGFNNCKVDKVESQTSSSKTYAPLRKSTPTINPSPNPEINQSLFKAVKEGNSNKVREVLNNGANINYQDKHSNTALMYAISKGHIEIVRLLLENGANVNYQTYNGYTALRIASVDDYIEIVRLLLEAGATE